MKKLADVLRENVQPADELAAEIRKAVKNKPATLSELSSRFDRGVNKIQQAINRLSEQGYNVKVAAEGVSLVRDFPVGGTFRIDPKKIKGNKIRFGACGDNHACSKYERLDVSEAIYDWYAREGIAEVYHTGNMIDGQCRFNRFDLLPGCDSIEGQVGYNAKVYPQRKGIKTKFIAGNDHEGWYVQNAGINIGQLMQQAAEAAGRTDLEYLSYMEADLRFPAEKGDTWVRVCHPGGGSAYATSYTSQKLVESLQGGEKPAVMLIGHYHKMEYGRHREVMCVQTGCMQDQTPFMRSKRLDAQIGGWIIELEQAPDGHIASITLSDRRFFDRKFYEHTEKFKRW